MRTDLVEALVRALEIDGVELRWRNAFCHDRSFVGTDHPFGRVQHPRSGEFLHIPDILPALGPTIWEGLRAPGNPLCVDIVANAIGEDHVLWNIAHDLRIEA